MFELHVKPCQANEAEAISAHLETSGALAVTLVDQEDDPILEPGPGETPLWQYAIAEALFPSAEEAKAAWDALSLEYPALSHEIKALPDQNWLQTCQQDITPLSFGKKLWVCPSSHTPPDEDAVNIILDPGLAFGTGTHPTTSLCLQFLDSTDVTHQNIIDYGCGSGILAIAALKLGATMAYAVDLDEQALIATHSNAEKNQIPTKQLVCSMPEKLIKPADILLANILLTPLLSLKSRFESLLNPGGQLVLSGILNTQVDELLHAYQTTAFMHQSTQYEEEWACVIFEKIK